MESYAGTQQLSKKVLTSVLGPPAKVMKEEEEKTLAQTVGQLQKILEETKTILNNTLASYRGEFPKPGDQGVAGSSCIEFRLDCCVEDAAEIRQISEELRAKIGG